MKLSTVASWALLLAAPQTALGQGESWPAEMPAEPTGEPAKETPPKNTPAKDASKKGPPTKNTPAKNTPAKNVNKSKPQAPASEPAQQSQGQQEPPKEQQPESFEKVSLRVQTSRPSGLVIVDRGTRDGLQAGDRVLFYPRSGGTLLGRVGDLNERTATVELREAGRVLPAGTKGEAFVPSSRFGKAAPVAPKPEPTPVPEPEVTTPESQAAEEHEPWANEDDGWSEDMPLLAQVQAERPEDRETNMSGRVYFIGDGRVTTDSERSDSFLRTGTDLLYENLFGKGGALRIDGEVNYRNTQVPDDEDESEGNLRLDRFSYAWGGTRFAPNRHEFGRFLQNGMPEFGIVDGYEYGHRFDNGDSFGASLGFMPEPDYEMATGEDVQVAAYYRWVGGINERLAWTTGYQKTWHNGTRDRDLIITKLAYLPLSGWDFFGTAWVDLYTSKDEAKGSGPEVTQANLSTSRNWQNGNGMSVSYRHLRFPELFRNEFRPVAEEQLADDHNDRLWLTGWRQMGKRKLHGQVGAWVDERDEGGDVQLGFEKAELFSKRGIGDVTVFYTRGEVSWGAGARLSYGKFTSNGRWDVYYEIANHSQDGFLDENDEILQHALRASRDFYTKSGWSLSLYGDTRTWDEEAAFSLGVYATRSF